MKDFAILVNTCDKFEDCWEPFFKLFTIYWPDYKGKIYLNTESKNYTYKNLNIISLKVCEKEQDALTITWSECLKRALEAIDSDIILYMQEDYFFKDRVKDNLIDKYVYMMIANTKIDCIHLTDQSLKAEKESCEYEGLKLAKLRQRYRVSCQAALWRKDVLLSYIRTYENAWQFEEFGSQRSVYMRHNFYVVDNNWVKLNHFEIIPYIFTGIIQGRWYEEVLPLFEKHDICVDFTKRGFVQDAPKKTFLNRGINIFKKIPVWVKNKYEIGNLKK